jgi:hypothetical protein
MPAPDPTLADRLAELSAEGVRALGWDPETLAEEWLEPLTLAGVPFATGGETWDAHHDAQATRPALAAGDVLYLPPLAVFRNLTSLPLKPVREWVRCRFGVRLQTGTGVHLLLWSNQLILVNRAPSYRGGFLHGPQRGMRTVVALEPGQCQQVVY